MLGRPRPGGSCPGHCGQGWALQGETDPGGERAASAWGVSLSPSWGHRGRPVGRARPCAPLAH
eukprot:1001772-Pyramimonas_sp.AAC.1